MNLYQVKFDEMDARMLHARLDLFELKTNLKDVIELHVDIVEFVSKIPKY